MSFKLPLIHNFEGIPCLVVGGGKRAARKARWLIKAAAQLTVVAPDIEPEFLQLLDASKSTVLQRKFQKSDLSAEFHLVIAATDDALLNKEIYQLATNQRQLVNCVDDPQHCNVTFPAIVDRSPLLVAVTTSGTVPALARVVRGWIEQILPMSLTATIPLLERLRTSIREAYPDLDERTHAYNRLLNPESLRAIETETSAATLQRISGEESAEEGAGKVILVGAGPGDPDLITLKGLRAIQEADVIFYDQLASPTLLEYARRDAEQIYVGKQGPKPGEPADRPNNRSTQQVHINEQILAAAMAGKHVVRLKGGDPYIYGRGGEEVRILADAGIEVEVVPGITAALGAASYAGIPLTHRDHAQSIRFVTGHRVENTVNLEWPELGKPDQTLVIYMGLVGLAQITAKLISFGAPNSRPVALIENATLPEQREVIGTLETIADMAREHNVVGPTVVIVGDVVSLHRESSN